MIVSQMNWNFSVAFGLWVFGVIKLFIDRMNSGQTVQDYNMLSVIGKGTYAKVLLVRSKLDSKVYAMKVLKKKHIIEKNQ